MRAQAAYFSPPRFTPARHFRRIADAFRRLMRVKWLSYFTLLALFYHLLLDDKFQSSPATPHAHHRPSDRRLLISIG